MIELLSQCQLIHQLVYLCIHMCICIMRISLRVCMSDVLSLSYRWCSFDWWINRLWVNTWLLVNPPRHLALDPDTLQVNPPLYRTTQRLGLEDLDKLLGASAVSGAYVYGSYAPLHNKAISIKWILLLLERWGGCRKKLWNCICTWRICISIRPCHWCFSHLGRSIIVLGALPRAG